jgi:hypothetical protein
MRAQGANISEAFRRVWARPWLLMALALTNIGLAVLMSAPLSSMLATLLDHRTAATAMAAGDDALWIELLGDHSAIMAVASVALAGGVIIYGLFSWILDGGVLAALALDGERRAVGARGVLAQSATRAGRMVKLGLMGTLLRVVPLLFGGAAYGIARAVIKGRTFQPNLMTSMLALAAAALAWTAVSVAIDYARGLSLDDSQTRSWRLLARGVRLLFTRRAATLQLVAFSMAAWLAVGVLYWLIAGHLSGIGLLTLVRLFAVVARVAITMTTLTAAARVTRA